MIRGFKIGVTKWMRANTSTQVVWQRNYYEHIIRNDESLDRIRNTSPTTLTGGHLTVRTLTRRTCP